MAGSATAQYQEATSALKLAVKPDEIPNLAATRPHLMDSFPGTRDFSPPPTDEEGIKLRTLQFQRYRRDRCGDGLLVGRRTDGSKISPPCKRYSLRDTRARVERDLQIIKESNDLYRMREEVAKEYAMKQHRLAAQIGWEAAGSIAYPGPWPPFKKSRGAAKGKPVRSAREASRKPQRRSGKVPSAPARSTGQTNSADVAATAAVKRSRTKPKAKADNKWKPKGKANTKAKRK